MTPKYEIGDVVSGSNLTENFKNQTLTAVGFTRGSDQPNVLLRCHESDSPTLIADIENGEPIEFVVVSYSDTIGLAEARAKFGNLWNKKKPARQTSTARAMARSQAA